MILLISFKIMQHDTFVFIKKECTCNHHNMYFRSLAEIQNDTST